MDVSEFNATERAGVESSAPRQKPRLADFAAIIVGVGLAIVISVAGGPAAVWGKTAGRYSPRKSIDSGSALDRDLYSALDREKPQSQAEFLLQRAASGSETAPAQIESRIESWRGHLTWNSQLSDLTTAALASNDLSVRASAIEVQIAAYGLNKNSSTVNTLIRKVDSRDHAQQIWALWALGLLANRGVETDQIVQTLIAQLKKSTANEDTRRWAVEGLALTGTNSTIAPLLDAMHNDPSAMVRERAACSLAQSGMLSHEQRLTAVPRLITYSDDTALDPQTQGWAFQALSDITKQHLPNDSAARRNWYQESAVSGQ